MSLRFTGTVTTNAFPAAGGAGFPIGFPAVSTSGFTSV